MGKTENEAHQDLTHDHYRVGEKTVRNLQRVGVDQRKNDHRYYESQTDLRPSKVNAVSKQWRHDQQSADAKKNQQKDVKLV